MKKSLFAALVILTSLNALAQGTVVLNNRNSLGTSHVWGTGLYLSLVGNATNDLPAGTTPYASAGCILIGANGTGGSFGAATTFAQLLAANGSNQPASSLVPMGQVTTFRTGAYAGLLVGITDTLEGIPADAFAATLDLVVWDNTSGLYPTWTQASAAWERGQFGAFGQSGPFNVFKVGGNINTPPDLPIPSFNIFTIPEPAAATLAVLAAAMLAVCRREVEG
jgi:hypothetical protein